MAPGPDASGDARRSVWSIEPVASGPGSATVRVDAIPVEVASDQVDLHDVPEAWATAFCLPASRHGVTLASPSRVDEAWRAGAAANVAAAAAWWGGDPVLRLEVPPRRRFGRRPRRPTPSGASGGRGRALCFTGGVDSFFSLLVGDHRPTHLLYVAGFDVPLDDTGRLGSVVDTLDAVADDVGASPLVVRTDLREHPRFASISWEHTHGAALAAVGHLLHETVDTMVIPPSYAASRLVPWGSRPDLDPRWSVPGRFAVEHGDASGRRLDRVLAIASHPLVHRHLRVCWQNVDGSLNCGRCEKCVRTMAMLAAADQLQCCETFPDRGDLPTALDGLDRVDAALAPLWRDLRDLPLRPQERAAVDALLDRSR